MKPEKQRAFRAQWVLPVSSPPLRDGVVVIEGGRILKVGAWRQLRSRDTEDLGDAIILPGLINAHCHLDYTGMRGLIPPPSDFSQWIRRINELKLTLTTSDTLAAVQAGLGESLQTGTTTVLNIESVPEILTCLPKPSSRVWWFLEALDIRHPPPPEFCSWIGEPVGRRVGVSPHAPYTASLELYRRAARLSASAGLPFTTHVAETLEEFEMFTLRRGALHDFLKGLGRSGKDLDGTPPFSRLALTGALPQGAILAHMNWLAESDWEILARDPSSYSVAHCPRCHAYFDRPPFAWERFRRLGINVCLGTDSLASNASLDMFAEMRELLRAHPEVSPAEALRMATLAGARAMGQQGLLGELRPGAHADLVVKPLPADTTEPEAAVIADERPPERIMVEGKFVA